MSFREKTAWISLLTTLVVWGYYFTVLLRALSAGNADGGNLMGMFVGCVVLLIAMQIVFGVIAAMRTPGAASTPADERERLIEAKATRIAYVVLGVGVMTVAALSPFVAAGAPFMFRDASTVNTTLIMANGIVLAVVFAELVKSGGQAVFFRLGNAR